LNFTGVDVNIGELSFPVSDVTVSTATKILLQGEQWFKGMPLDIVNYKDFLNSKYRSKEYGAIVLREYFLEPYKKLRKIIKRYFTCEGRFGRIYQYHFRLLMHFIGKIPLNMPFYLFRSLSKMAYKVQGNKFHVEPSIFHFSLNKLLVVEELRKSNQSWQAFIDSSKLTVEFQTSS